MTGWIEVPEARRLRIRNASVPVSLVIGTDLETDGDGLARADLVIENGMVAKVAPVAPAASPGSGTGEAAPDETAVDLDGGLVFPCFVDMHTHIDKGHIWPRRPNPDGSFGQALEAVRQDRMARWTAEDVRRRMDFSLRCAYAHGTRLLRTHIDSLPPQHTISWPVFRELRAAWRGRIDLQGVSLVPIEMALDADALGIVAEAVADVGGVLGGVALMVPRLEEALDALFTTAAALDLDVDLHVDETEDPGSQALRVIAETALRRGFKGRVVCGHCCSLALQSEDEMKRTLDLVAKARIGIVSLPMCNLYLQDRHAGRTPRWRGVTLLHEMRERGIPVAVASDNTRDPFYAYGDLDMLEVFREATRILHLDHPFDGWPGVVARAPADIVTRQDCGRIGKGLGADLVLFRARRWTELLARPQCDRVVLHAGRAIDTALPDYRELDDLMGAA